MSEKKNKKYSTSFNKTYSDEFPFITSSKSGVNYAFCTVCSTDILIKHKGRGDITQHIEREKHRRMTKTLAENKTLGFSFVQNDMNVIRAECMFTSFIIEHNLPISVADHVGPLLRNMFPDSKIAKQYGCARTKTTAIIGEMAHSEKIDIAKMLRTNMFSISTDGSNKGDFKLFPIVATCYDQNKLLVETHLFSVPVLEGDATGCNIAKLVLDSLKVSEIPLENCLALGVDNAPVMVGKKNGVGGILTKDIPQLFVQGCLCHLVNLAAEKGANCIPVNIEEYIIDIFFYLEKSVKRKEKLKKFQELHNTETRKVLKHVSTRWLSLGRCLSRLLQQWEPLTSFFKEEVKDSSSVALPEYTIPKLKSSAHLPKSESVDKGKRKMNDNVQPAPKKQKVCDNVNLDQNSSASNILSRVERLFMFLSSDLNKAYVNFLLHILPVLEHFNVTLQCKSPKIHILRQLMNELFKTLLSKFMLPNVVKSSKSLLEVNFYSRDNQKEDVDLVVGQTTNKIVESLSDKEKKSFYAHIRKYFVKVCDYMRQKFPFNDEVVINAEVANMENFDKASFSSVKFFIDRFPGLLKSLGDCSTVDELQSQFNSLQMEDFLGSLESEQRIDSKWVKLCAMFKNKYDLLSKFMLSILAIPHSNAECERIFSLVTKAHTQFRSSMTAKNLENLMTVKSKYSEPCFKQKFDDDFLKRAKSATVNKFAS